MLNKIKNDPALLEKTLDAIQVIQQFGYDVAFHLKTREYQVLEKDGTVVETFDEWKEIIAYADTFHDKRTHKEEL